MNPFQPPPPGANLGHGPPPPPYYGPSPPQDYGPVPYPPHLHAPYQHTYPPAPDYSQVTASGHMCPPPPDGGQVTAPQPYPYYMAGTMMVPVPIAPMQMPQPDSNPPPPPQPTYITNYIYHGEGSNPTPSLDPGKAVELSGEFDWVPTTATTAAHLTGQAVVGGHEGWDGSPLWVIRAWHNGELVPGKFSIRHNAASIVFDGKEIPVQNIDVLIAKPENLRWIPASNGNVPPGAIPGGRTSSGEALYVGRARHQLSITPGKVHPSHNSCYIAFAGTEVSHKVYDVLCRIS